MWIFCPQFTDRGEVRVRKNFPISLEILYPCYEWKIACKDFLLVDVHTGDFFASDFEFLKMLFFSRFLRRINNLKFHFLRRFNKLFEIPFFISIKKLQKAPRRFFNPKRVGKIGESERKEILRVKIHSLKEAGKNFLMNHKIAYLSFRATFNLGQGSI